MFSKRNFGLTDSLIEVSKKVSEDYQEKVKGLMAKMGIKSLKDLSDDEKRKFFNKLDDMHTAKHEEVELDEAKSNFRGKKYAYDSDKHFGGKGTPEQRLQLLKLSNKALKAVPNSPAQKKIQKEIQALRKEMGMRFKEEVDLDEAKEARIVFRYKTQADNYAKKMGGRVKKVGHLFYVVKEEVDFDEAKVMGKEVYDKTFANKTQADNFAKKVGGRVRKVGRVFYVFKEEVDLDEAEQVDEISKSTMGSYLKKASDQLHLRGYKGRGYDDAIETGEHGKSRTRQLKRIRDRNSKAIAKRQKGIERVASRLSKEEFEQVDELKSKTLKSYISKAGKDLSKRVADYHSKDIASSPSKINKRGLAIDKAKGRLSMNRQLGRAEEVEQFDETTDINTLIKMLQKEAEPLRGQRVKLSLLKKRDKLFAKIKDDKKALEKIYKADIPFYSTKASTILISKHKYKAPDVLKIKGQVEHVEEGVGDKHQKKIAIDTLKNPKKALLGGMSVSDAEKVLKTKFKYSDAQIKKLKEDESIDEKNFGKPSQPDHYRHMGNTPLQRKKVKPGCEEKDPDVKERTLTPDEEEKKEKIVMSLKDKAADFEKRYPGKGKQVMYAVATKMAKKD